MEKYGVYVGIAAFIIGLIAHAVKLTWRISRIEIDLREEFDAQIDNVQRDIRKLEADTLDEYRREVGETMAAIRQKIHDVETWSRDNFVRSETFDVVVVRIEKSLEKIGDRFEEKMDRILDMMQKRDK